MLNFLCSDTPRNKVTIVYGNKMFESMMSLVPFQCECNFNVISNFASSEGMRLKCIVDKLYALDKNWLPSGSSVEPVCCLLKEGQNWPPLSFHCDMSKIFIFMKLFLRNEHCLRKRLCNIMVLDESHIITCQLHLQEYQV